MLSNLKKNQSGFTIIEVLIVLAIAGLIMVAVFTAVPALQRNGNNTTKRGDASKVLGAVSEFVANNNGKVPLAADAGTITSSANFSSGTTVTVVTGKAAITALASSSDIQVVTGVSCVASPTLVTAATLSAANFQSIVNAASARSYAVVYAVEASGGNITTQCTGS